MKELRELPVNIADWDGPDDLPDGWLIANASRPLAGERTWTARFRHGIFYAASPGIREGRFGWKADDAWLITFTSNEEISTRCAAKVAEHGYADLAAAAADDITVEEIAAMMQLPWHAGGDRA